MSIPNTAERLLTLPGVVAGKRHLSPPTHYTGQTLPASHIELLHITGGSCSAYFGYFRLFGSAECPYLDIAAWNAPLLWKFSWPVPVRNFLCFGETAWGDQYAYRCDQLHLVDPPVYFLEYLTMNPELLSSSFEGFLEAEFLRNAVDPYDEAITSAHRLLGPLSMDKHVVIIPSPLLTGSEELGTLQTMDALGALIVGGDIATQVAARPPGARLQAVMPWQDDHGRVRIRVDWTPSA